MTGAAIGIGAGLVAAGTAIAAGGMTVSGTKPGYSYYGGSKGMLDSYRQRDAFGVASGGEQALTGGGLLTNSAAMGNEVGAQGKTILGQGNVTNIRGQGVSQLGLSQMQAGIASQNQALGMLGSAAQGQAPSQAEMLMQAQAADIQRQQMAMAASARGGNQAAAMRAAGAEGRMAIGNAAQQAGAMRAAEMAQARGQFAQAAQGQLAGGQGITQAGLAQQNLGLNQQQAGLGAMQFNVANTGQAGQALGQLGASREGNYLGAENSMNNAQLEADTQVRLERSRAQRDKRAGWLNLGGSLIGAGGNILGSSGSGSSGGSK